MTARFLARGLMCLLAAALCSGCIPNVAWTPDGGGIVFTEKDGRRLVYYDLKKNERAVLVEDTKTRTLWPAVSPDGKRVAVASWLREKDLPDRMQVIVYRLGGVEEYRSSSFELESSRKNMPDQGETYLLWGTNDHLIVAAKPLAIYDLKKDRLTTIEGNHPWTVGGFQPRPDGKGFLALRDGQAKDGLAFVDWSGKVSVIPFANPFGDDFPDLFPLRWEGNTAVLSGPLGVVRIDTAKATVRREAAEIPPLLPDTGKVRFVHVFPGGNSILCVVECKELRGGNMHEFSRVEIQEPRTKKRRVILRECDVIPHLFPSPDRSRVALRYGAAMERKALLVIDAQGRTLADFTSNW